MNNLQLVKSEKFGNIPCDFYSDGKDYFMTREQIGRSLEYSNPIIAISKIHDRHKERLDKYSVVTRLVSTDGKVYDTTVYNRKGIMEICRWSQQTGADAFMDWTWNIMDGLMAGDIKAYKPMTQAEIIAAQANLLVEIEKKTNTALEATKATQKQLNGALDVLAAPTPIDWQAATGDRIKHICKINGLSYLKVYDALYRELEHGTGSNLKIRLRNEKNRQRESGHKMTDVKNLTQLYIIAHDKKLKMAFDGIVRRFAAKYANREV
ncbi:MAG: hypothetical protein M0R51_13610 [Clostridia bacterium]|jgi:hypothetical protein|nr:hypothetical protein [Clostridia bacterium]